MLYWIGPQSADCTPADCVAGLPPGRDLSRATVAAWARARGLGLVVAEAALAATPLYAVDPPTAVVGTTAPSGPTARRRRT